MAVELVSIVMPAYNCEKHIYKAIESILLQTYSNFEFIIINDGSTDLTNSIVKKFSDERIKYFAWENNRGIVYSLNFGIKNAKGAFILRMDADDIALPTRLELQVGFMTANPSIDVAGAKAIFFDDSNPDNNSVHGELVNSHNVVKALLFLFSPYVHPTIIFRNSSSNRKYLYYSEDCNYGDDYDFFCRNIEFLKFGYLDQIVLKYRIHQSADRLSNANKIEKYKSSTFKIRARYFAHYFPDINCRLVKHYEDLFYNDVKVSHISLKKTILFYLKFYEIILNLDINTHEYGYIQTRVNASYYNSVYRYSKIGVASFFLYHKYSKRLARFKANKEVKFFFKSLLGI